MAGEQQTQTQPKRILIVEDDTPIREMYVQILKPDGYDIDTASNGAEGYTKIYNNEYDLILLDILMPHMKGTEILKKLHQDGKGKLTSKIVLLTNISQDFTVAEAVSLGVRGYIIKSDFTPEQIQQEVRNYLSS